MVERFEIPSLDEKELKYKLENIRYPNELEDDDVGWKLGAPTWAVQQMVHNWKNNFSWEKSRAEMNQWHHYKTDVDGFGLHFVHEPSSSDKAIPLVLLHGWPSSFYEFHKIISPLSKGANGNQPFHVVVPSLPGYGFSDPPKSEGCGVSKIADLMNKLMLELGYDKYVVYGTDWGASIGTALAQRHSDHVVGFITNMPMPKPPLPTIKNLIFHPVKVLLFILSMFFGFSRIYGNQSAYNNITKFTFANVDKDNDAGYRAIQSTRPYTLAYGLTDSPVGLLGWMLEPYHLWTFHQSNEQYLKNALPETIDSDEFLTQVTIYWITNTMSSSYRLYYEAKKNLHIEMAKFSSTFISVPYAVTYYENEIAQFPKDWLELAGNLVQFKRHPKGGHFPALEEPSALLEDIQEFGSKVRRKKQSGHTPKKKEL